MNCKPGDLAVAPYRGLAKFDWEIEHQGKRYGSFDCNLRPIRDPGDDAKDESLLWKPVPKEGELTKDEADLLLEALREWAETAK